jgi:hypothetical protein
MPNFFIMPLILPAAKSHANRFLLALLFWRVINP